MRLVRRCSILAGLCTLTDLSCILWYIIWQNYFPIVVVNNGYVVDALVNLTCCLGVYCFLFCVEVQKLKDIKKDRFFQFLQLYSGKTFSESRINILISVLCHSTWRIILRPWTGKPEPEIVSFCNSTSFEKFSLTTTKTKYAVRHRKGYSFIISARIG